MATDFKKNIFELKNNLAEKIKSSFTKQSDEQSKEESDQQRIITYKESGFIDCRDNNASAIAFANCLNRIFAQFQNEERVNKHKQDEARKPYLNEQKSKETEIKGLEVSLENKNQQIKQAEESIEKVKSKIEEKKFENNDLPQNPEKYGVDAKKGASTKFWLGILIIIPITLYLIVFYISTSYSAFFKKFDSSSGIIENVLDPLSFSKAWSEGFIEGAFVSLIPFVFMGLGYLIHMFGENKNFMNYGKIVLLFIITFIFDAILAYQIEEKLYELNKTFDSPPFDLGIAFTKIQFWGIIFAGFIVYIIWGLVFDFIMKEHAEKDKIKMALKQRWNDIRVLNERILEHEKEIDTLQKEKSNILELIAKAKGRISELQQIIDGVIIATREYRLYSTEYMQGWLTYLNKDIAMAYEAKLEIENKCDGIHKAHLNEVGANDNSLNTIFVSVN